jgi:hypothetical protein
MDQQNCAVLRAIIFSKRTPLNVHAFLPNNKSPRQGPLSTRKVVRVLGHVAGVSRM